MTSPHITPVQLKNQLCPLRFSACTYPQLGNFHEEHCNGAWLASHVVVVLTPTHITPAKKKIKKQKQNVVLSVLPLCVTVAVCFISLCALCSLCVFVYTLVLFHRFIYFYFIYNTELFIYYVHINF